MKTILQLAAFIVLLAGLSQGAEGQVLKSIQNKAKEKAKTKANEKIDKTLDKGVEKASDAIDTTVKKIVTGKDNNPSSGPNQLAIQGKFVTTEILFDNNSDQVKGESFMLLKEVADVLKENPDMRVKIVCHTDTDGDPATNLKLTKARAASVKSTLVKIFGVDESRLESDGEGGNTPFSKNRTEEGKAMNRRVEFLRI
jgi:outer membrane protein OmpA-like peptidoglycan-associated protein